MYKIEQLVLKIFFFEIHYFEETVQHSNNISEENQLSQFICVGSTRIIGLRLSRGSLGRVEHEKHAPIRHVEKSSWRGHRFPRIINTFKFKLGNNPLFSDLW